MKRNKTLFTVIVLIGILFIADLIFKINYSKDDFYKISNLKLNDSIQIQGGQIFLGKNVKGAIEAIIFPDNIMENEKNLEIEYIYMRFYPEWFIGNIKPIITKTNDKADQDLIVEVKKIHEDNFRNYMHINKYPLVRKDYVPVVIKRNNLEKKERFSYNLQKH